MVVEGDGTHGEEKDRESSSGRIGAENAGKEGQEGDKEVLMARRVGHAVVDISLSRPEAPAP